ncbi:MAG: hypothetical protein Q8P86_02820 [bacterium]|nr:hypothetical protein [bacterium]
MNDDLKWFFGLFLLFGLLWFGGGGLNSSSSHDPFVEPITGRTYGNDPLSGLSNKSGSQISTGGNRDTENGAIKEEEKPDTISIQRVNQSYGDSPDFEYVTLVAGRDNKAPIKLTGLQLLSRETGKGMTIGKATKLPHISSPRDTDDIFLDPGEKAYVISGRSPVGFSFKTNTCSGYFATEKNLTPGLYYECPRTSEKPLPYFRTVTLKDQCLDYLDRIPRCNHKTPSTLSAECASYVSQNFNYNACVSENSGKDDFYKNEWYVYLERIAPLWKSRRETVDLVSPEGVVLDSIKY